LGGRLYALAFLTLWRDPQHQLKMWLGASQNQSRYFRERKVCCELYRHCSIMQPIASSQQTMPTSSMTPVYNLVRLKIESFRFYFFIPNNIYTAHYYTNTAFTRAILHPKYIRIRLLRVFVESRFQFPKPTTYFNMPLSADYSLIFEHQQLVKSENILYLFCNCKSE